MNFKRKQYKSSTMKKCGICGSQRRQKKNDRKKPESKKVKPTSDWTDVIG